MEDPFGRVYIFERGQLTLLEDRYRRRSVLNPPSVIASPSSASSQNISTPLSASQPLRTPLSLVRLVCGYVCRHFDHVDSLFGLPDDLGRHLFEAGLENGLFADCTSPALRKFAEAFRVTFASHLDLSRLDYRRHFDLFSLLPQLPGLVELRIDHCHLDAAPNALLAQLARLPSLRHLGIRDNCLLDESLRTLSSPWRFRQASACVIEALDLRDNKYLTSKGLYHVLEVPSLKTIVFSSSVDLEEDIQLARCSKLGWRIARSETRTPKSPSQGWLVEVLTQWRLNNTLTFDDITADTSMRLLVFQRKEDPRPTFSAASARKRRKMSALEAASLASVPDLQS